MKAKAKNPKRDLELAALALRSDEPSPEVLADSRERGYQRLFGTSKTTVDSAPIRGCSGIEALLPAYRRGALPTARALLIRSHLAECATCRELYARRGTLRVASRPWQRSLVQPVVATGKARGMFLSLAAAAVLFFGLWFARTPGLVETPSVQLASVQSVSGVLYRIGGAATDRVMPGAPLMSGQAVRAGDAPQSVLRLTDGSEVELGERAEFSVEAQRSDTILRLKRGQIIVKAAKRKAGHLYVATRDCRVAVKGTVFSVMSDLKGSRVSVLEGRVQIAELTGSQKELSRGDQLTTNPSLARVPIAQEVGWSRHVEEHLALLKDVADLGKSWRSVRAPELRYASILLDWVPDNTLLYASLPNYGTTLVEGYRLFKTKLDESPILRQWWQSSEAGAPSAQLDGWFAKLHELSSYLGDELLITVSPNSGKVAIVAFAEVKRTGIGDFMGTALMLQNGNRVPLTIVSEQEITSEQFDERKTLGALLLVTPKFIAFSSEPRALKEVARRVSSGKPGGFAGSSFGQRVSAAYERGIGLLVAADLEKLSNALPSDKADFERSLRTFEFEHKEVERQSVNRGVLTFAEGSRGLASWLGPPAPMGSLDFLTPNAGAVAAFLTQRPDAILADVLRSIPGAQDSMSRFVGVQAGQDHGFCFDCGDALGTEVAIALDGPLLPTPSWKLIFEVRDRERLESALERGFTHVDRELRSRGQGSIALEHERLGSRTIHQIKWVDGKLPIEATYAFVEGYLLVTPTRALLARAIDARTSGVNLANSPRFTATLPRDGRAELSGLVFQDLMGTLAAAVGDNEPSPTADQRHSVDDFVRSSKPSLVGFYASPDRLEMASAGDLFGFGPEALALPALIRHIFPEPNHAKGL